MTHNPRSEEERLLLNIFSDRDRCPEACSEMHTFDGDCILAVREEPR